MSQEHTQAGILQFPVTGKALAQMAAERASAQYEALGTKMVDDLFPATLRAIFSEDEAIKALLAIKPDLDIEKLIAEISQQFWSNPGLIGKSRIESQFKNAGFNETQCELLGTLTYQFSRFSMALVNNFRMQRSAITAITDAVDEDAYIDRFMKYADKSDDLNKSWQKRAKTFGAQTLSNAEDIQNWLEELEPFIAQASSAITWARRRDLQAQDPNGYLSTSSMSASMAQSFTRRFGQYVRNEFQISGLSGRYATREDSLADEIATLTKVLHKDSDKVYQFLKEDYEKRQNRITALKSRDQRINARKDFSYFENLISNHLQMNGRPLVVRNTKGSINPELIEQMYKLFITQTKLEPDMQKFIAKVSEAGQVLEVELDAPTNRDATKLKKFLTTLFE